MKTTNINPTRFTEKDILQILIDIYQFMAYFSLSAKRNCNINFQTTMEEFAEIYQLEYEDKDEFADYLSELFNIKNSYDELAVILYTKTNTVYTLCKYIADNAIKETPVALSEILDPEKEIFRVLKNELERKRIDTKDFTPDTEFTPFFYKHKMAVLEIVSKLAPGTISYYKFKSTIIDYLKVIFFLLSAGALIFVSVSSYSVWFMVPVFVLAIVFTIIAKKTEVHKADISGYKTVEDLIIGMEKRMNS